MDRRGDPSIQHSNIVQILDNVTWNKGQHTFKFGADFRRMTDHDDNVFGNYRSGQYVFDNSRRHLQTRTATRSALEIPLLVFFFGLPDYTILSEQVDHPAMNGLGYGYGFFAQDDWKLTSNLTLNLGLRYELHPPLKDTKYNTAAFLPDYNQNGVTGAVAVPNQQALGYTSSMLGVLTPSPIITAKQAGIPETLRYTYKKDFGPRVGFAWRPKGNDKLVFRGDGPLHRAAAWLFAGIRLGRALELPELLLSKHRRQRKPFDRLSRAVLFDGCSRRSFVSICLPRQIH